MAEESQAPQQGPEEVTQTIDVKTAVNSAMDYFKELFGSPFADLALEEVEQNIQGKWVVTLGYSMARRSPAGGVSVIPNVPRQYKQIVVDQAGEVESMKVRRL